VYALFSAVLGFGLATGRPLLQALLGTTYPGLTALGWRKLTINWTIFFAAMAVLNEVVWRSTTTDQWVFFKFPGCVIITLVFALANVPMLLKNGLSLGDTDEAPVPPAD
jgi:intracellular septation protein